MKRLLALKKKAVQIRMDILTMIYNAGAGHTGSSLGCTDILTSLYFDVLNVDPERPLWEERDRYIQSKGHAAEVYYCILANKGFFPKEELQTFSQYGSRLIGHPNNKVPGIEMNTGALGHGLSIAVGMALAAKMERKSYRVFTLMGDGEMAEGSIWEGAMAASHYKLDNLVGIVDRNRLQITGSTEDVMSLEPITEKWKSFGWEVAEVDGHDLEQLGRKLKQVPFNRGKPSLVIAHTIKGKGISLAENVARWHHRVPNAQEYEIAMRELSEELQVLERAE